MDACCRFQECQSKNEHNRSEQILKTGISPSTSLIVAKFRLEINSGLSNINVSYEIMSLLGLAKKVLCKSWLHNCLQGEGFDPVTFLPKAEPWMNVQVMATRPG